ncbi:galactose oxidase [Halosquirtibacter laminarini]|uniref:Galactose oxidase n=1 Tax=Halosquirtibacter laminarini TaxID=3374600 RepID=A0AC61NG87_9BACT|nr:galactose oxidase [Prolixibacteraceae bacterium]
MKIMKIANLKWMLSLMIIIGFASCSSNDDDEYGNWVRMSDFDGLARGSATSFTVDNKAYVGLGFGDDDRNNDTYADGYLKDFWMYNPSKNSWTQIQDFPGVARTGAVSFASNNSGYVGTGWDGDYRLKDFYKYDVNSGTWTKIDDFMGTARRNAVAFTIDNKGYVGTGFDGNDQKDFYKYDTQTQQWSKVSSLGSDPNGGSGGSKRQGATAFVLNNQGYVLTGFSNGIAANDVYAYDAENDTWTKKRDLDWDDNELENIAVMRKNAISFVMDGTAYVGLGFNNGIQNDIWYYDEKNDDWEEKEKFEGSARENAVAFTLNGEGYIALGSNGSYDFDDIWKYQPWAEQDSDDN